VAQVEKVAVVMEPMEVQAEVVVETAVQVVQHLQLDKEITVGLMTVLVQVAVAEQAQ
jgi:hypothetical protein